MGDLIDPVAARETAERIWSNASPSERQALMNWLQLLAVIRDSQTSSVQKSFQAIRCTVSSKALWPLVKTLGLECKRVGWDERSSKWRAFLGGAGAGLVIFGGQGAGIAALGGAIGVPLWLVLGGGAAVLDALLDSSRPADRGKGEDDQDTP